jgi:hypothetical protein
MTTVDEQIVEQRALLDQMDRGETTREEQRMDCKIYGCTNEAAAERGRYAGLCDEHREIQVAKSNGGGAGEGGR